MALTHKDWEELRYKRVICAKTGEEGVLLDFHLHKGTQIAFWELKVRWNSGQEEWVEAGDVVDMHDPVFYPERRQDRTKGINDVPIQELQRG